jgi:hypothetical protein
VEIVVRGIKERKNIRHGWMLYWCNKPTGEWGFYSLAKPANSGNIWREKIAGTYGGNKWCKKMAGKLRGKISTSFN